jgi:hypothetical protein
MKPRRAARRRKPGTMIVTACLGRHRKAADAADRQRTKARDRKRRERERKKDDGNVVRVPVTVDYELGCRLVREGVLDEWDMENRDAVAAALQAYLDLKQQYE